MTPVRLAGMVLLLGFSISCGSSSSQNLTGAWQFTVSSAVLADTTYVGNATLAQNGKNVTGNVTFSNNPCATTGPITGTVNGLAVNLQVTEGSQIVIFNGTINSTFTTLTGNYTAPAGGCLDGDYGSWSAALTSGGT